MHTYKLNGAGYLYVVKTDMCDPNIYCNRSVRLYIQICEELVMSSPGGRLLLHKVQEDKTATVTGSMIRGRGHSPKKKSTRYT